jgi:hypothetical protein
MYSNDICKFYFSKNYPLVFNRTDIPKLMNDYYIDRKVGKITTCEIGVRAGNHSAQILDTLPLLDEHIMIDCWMEQDEKIYKDGANKPNNIQENIFNNCVKNTKRFEDKIKFIRKLSNDAIDDIPDKHIDYLYIDANHSYEAVKNDLNLWVPKMKPNSIIAGHDYVVAADFGVIKAVNEYAINNKKIIFLTRNVKENLSWFIFL